MPGFSVFDTVKKTSIANDGISNATQFALSWALPLWSTFSIWIDGKMISSGNIAWSTSGLYYLPKLGLGEGAHAFEIRYSYWGKETKLTQKINLDYTPPIGSITAVTDDKGLVAEGGITDDPSVSVTGKTEANAWVSILDNGKLMGSTQADKDGNWSVNLSTLSIPGLNSLVAKFTDIAGNSSNSTLYKIFFQPPPPPSTLSIDNTIGTDKGIIASGSVTNDPTIVLSGTGSVGAKISVYDNGDKLGETMADINGKWHFTTPKLKDGTHSQLYIEGQFADGKTLTSKSVSVTIDTSTWINIAAVESDFGEVPYLASTQDATLLIKGKAEAGAKVILSSDASGATIYGSSTADKDGNWSILTPSLTVNPSWPVKTLYATATDSAGNIAKTPPFIFKLVPPRPVELNLFAQSDEGIVKNGGITRDSTLGFSGIGLAGKDITLIDTKFGNWATKQNIWTAKVDNNGKWSLTSTQLQDGKHSLYVTSIDSTGKPISGADILEFTIDTRTAGDISAVMSDEGMVRSGQVTKDRSLLVQGWGEAGAIFTLKDNGQTISKGSISASGGWSTEISNLTFGEHQLTVDITDAAGNQINSNPYKVTVLTSGINSINPYIKTDTGYVTPGGKSTDDTVLVSGEGVIGSSVSIFDNGLLLGTSAVDSNGQWSYNTNPLSDGKHNVYADITKDGTSVTTLSVNFSIDTTQIRTPDHNWNNQSGWGKIDALKAYANLAKSSAIQNDANQLNGYSQGLLEANINDLNAAGITGKGIKIAILDSGIDLNNTDFNGRISKDSRNYINGGSIQDENGHGTAIASMIGANNDGVGLTGGAYDAELMICKIAGASGQGDLIALTLAIRDAADKGAQIINISYGGMNSDMLPNLIPSALDYALSKGSLIFASAGNKGESTPAFPASYAKGHQGMFAVGAYLPQLSGVDIMASYSNKAGSDSGYGFVDGYGGINQVYGLDSKIVGNFGTSFASPVASVEAALLLSSGLGLSSDQVARAIINGSTALG